METPRDACGSVTATGNWQETEASATRSAQNSWWILPAATGAVVAGVLGALQLRSGQFVPGLLLVAVSVCLVRWPRSMWLEEDTVLMSKWRRRLALLAVCAVGVFFRVHQMESPGLWGDDAINGLLALDVLDGKIHSPFQIVRHSHSHFFALSNYFIAGSFWAFGPGSLALRLPGIVAGILAVPLLYGTAAPLFGARVALVAALLFASSPVQVAHSKVLTQVMFGEFFQLLGLCLLVRGVCGTRRWMIWAAGAPLALCVYTYHSARLAPLVAVVLGGSLLASRFRINGSTTPRRDNCSRANGVRDLAGAALVFAACVTPAVVSFVRNPSALVKRASQVALWPALRESESLWPLWDSVWRTLMIFPYQQGPVRYHWFGIGTEPAFNLVVVFLVVHGLVESLRRVNQPRHLFLLAWAFVGLIPGMLSTEAPRIYRVLYSTPALYVWAGLALVRLHDWATEPGSTRGCLRATVVALMLSVLILDYNQYFYRVYTSNLFRKFQAEPVVAIARELRSRGPGWSGRLAAPRLTAGYETLAFLSRAWGIRVQDVTSIAEAVPVYDEVESGVLFIVADGANGMIEALQSFYPSVDPVPHQEPDPRTWWFDSWFPIAAVEKKMPPSMVFFPVPKEVVEGVRGLTATYSDEHGTPVLSRVEPQLRLRSWPSLPAGHSVPAQVSWRGSVYAPADGQYRLELASNGTGEVWIDGVSVVSSAQPVGNKTLAQGLHRLAAKARVAGSPQFELRWSSPRGRMQTIPATFFYRASNVHGVLAEYKWKYRTLRRIEPYPYYHFFSARLAGTLSARWTGHVHIPDPGGYGLKALTNGKAQMRVGGKPLQSAEKLAAGTHDFELDITGIKDPPQLELRWYPPGGESELIPPQAFSPPGSETDTSVSCKSDERNCIEPPTRGNIRMSGEGGRSPS